MKVQWQVIGTKAICFMIFIVTPWPFEATKSSYGDQ